MVRFEIATPDIPSFLSTRRESDETGTASRLFPTLKDRRGSLVFSGSSCLDGWDDFGLIATCLKLFRLHPPHRFSMGRMKRWHDPMDNASSASSGGVLAGTSFLDEGPIRTVSSSTDKSDGGRIFDYESRLAEGSGRSPLNIKISSTDATIHRSPALPWISLLIREPGSSLLRHRPSPHLFSLCPTYTSVPRTLLTEHARELFVLPTSDYDGEGWDAAEDDRIRVLRFCGRWRALALIRGE